MRLLSTAIISSFLALAGLNAIESGSLGAGADFDGNEARSGSGSGSGSNRNQRRCRGGAYISAFASDQNQPITADAGFVGINFDLGNLSAKNILHPVGTDQSQFQVQRSGFYFIDWDVNFHYTSRDPLSTDEATVQLFNVTTSTVFGVPETMEVPSSTTDQATANLGGSVVVFLSRGTVVSLQIASANGTDDVPLVIDSGTLTMILLSK
jgi:hypothetical protein